ncbi:uncharacterized protein LOC107361664 [Tetranychus urticae]|uniref:Uncharacterized protein n=1 Tax=Tetranychus urticae TaxID=32264 RepID=T1KA01_TETUR|nr:uncharacterized protein LOC107361664 [Tetranychus urticae]
MPFYTKIGNFAAVTWCSFGSALLGLFLMLIGAILTAVAYTEITPPDYDDNYKRYIGSNVLRVVGPFSFGFGGLLVLGSCGLFTFAFVSESRKHGRSAGPIDYDARIAEPEVEKLQNP